MATTYDKIPDLLIDKNTIPNSKLPSFFPKQNSQERHLFCVLLRIFIGILILSDKISDEHILIFVILIIIGFGSKFLSYYNNKQNKWKNYLRNTLSFLTILVLQKQKVPNKNQLSGLLIIVDALMGQQSRYITTNMSRSAPN